MPLEWTIPHRDENSCYLKLICNKRDQVFIDQLLSYTNATNFVEHKYLRYIIHRSELSGSIF